MGPAPFFVISTEKFQLEMFSFEGVAGSAFWEAYHPNIWSYWWGDQQKDKDKDKDKYI